MAPTVETPSAIREHIGAIQAIVDAPLDIANKVPLINKAEELNALSYLILERQREQKLTVTKDVKDAIRVRLEQLNAVTVEKNLDALRSRLEYVQQLIAQPDPSAAQTPPPAPKGFFSNFSLGNIGGNIVSTLGGFVGGLGIPDFMKRGFFMAMTMPQFLPGGQFLGETLIDAGKRNLALMDLKDFLKTSPDFSAPASFPDSEWKQFKASGKSVDELVTLVAEYVGAIRAHESVAGPDDKTITLAKLLNVKSKETQFQNRATENLMLAVRGNAVWKTPGQTDIASVTFSDTETSVEAGGALTASRNDFDAATGAPKQGTKAFKLATMKQVLPHATRLVLGTEPTKATVEWIGGTKVATIPPDFGISLPVIDELLANSKPESVSKVEIADIDSLKSDTVELSYRDGEKGVVRIRKNADLLALLAKGDIKTLSAEESERRKWKLKDNKLEPIDPAKLS